MSSERALVVIDVQNDLCPGGAIAVPGGDRVVPVINEYVDRFVEGAYRVFFTRDWHPAETQHFQPWGGVWPPHCVQNTTGAELHAGLKQPRNATLVSKGVQAHEDGASALQAGDESGATLPELLKKAGARKLYVCGLATDHAVRATVLEARQARFDVTLLIDAVLGLDVQFGDTARAIDEMLRAGARTATLDTIDLEFGESGVALSLTPRKPVRRVLRGKEEAD